MHFSAVFFNFKLHPVSTTRAFFYNSAELGNNRLAANLIFETEAGFEDRFTRRDDDDALLLFSSSAEKISAHEARCSLGLV